MQMASQGALVDLLVKKGGFELPVALAIAEAIDAAMTNSEVVTVPILDARIAEFRADVRISAQELKSEIARVEHRINGLEQRFDSLEQRFDSLEQKFDGLEQKVERKFEDACTNLEKRLEKRLEKTIEAANERTKAELVRWVFAAMLGSATIGAAGAVIANAMQHYH